MTDLRLTNSKNTADSGGDCPSVSGVAGHLRTPITETPRQLLDRLRAMGVEFQGVEHSRLRVRGWRRLSAADQQAVNQQRQALLALLTAEQQPEPRTPALAKSDYHRVGIYIVNNTPTHALGDAYADDVIAGRIPRQQAEETERQTAQAARQLSGARLWRG